MRLIIFVLTALTLALPLTAARAQTFDQNVVITMGQRESQEDVRVYALAECKRLTLEKVGVYLQASTDLVQRVRDSQPPQLDAGESAQIPPLLLKGGSKGGLDTSSSTSSSTPARTPVRYRSNVWERSLLPQRTRRAQSLL